MTVAVIGLGGVGCELIRHLTAAGVGHLICIDADVVQADNLNRQIWYRPADIGLLKAECIEARLREFAPETQVSRVHAFVDSEADLFEALSIGPTSRHCDFIACCADEPVGGIESLSLSVGAHIGCAVGVAAMHLRRGYWGVFAGMAEMTRARQFFEVAFDVAAGHAGKVQGSASWTNAVISALFAEAVVSAIVGLPHLALNTLCAYDFDRGQVEITADFNAAARQMQGE